MIPTRFISLPTLLALLATAGPAARPADAAQAAQRPAAAPMRLAVTREDGFINVALATRDALVADVARALAAQLKLRIDVGPGLATERITLDRPAAPLEAVLQAIAPRVVVEYELRQDAKPLPLAVYLLSPTDPAPRTTNREHERGVSQGVVISGHTEETPTDDGKDPVTVSGDAQRLSIAARNQPLSLVAMIVADTLGVSLEMEYPAGELVTVGVTDVPAEDAVLAISPSVRLQVRVDLAAAERLPLKMRLVAPQAQAAR
jgi:hypothetical protein